jgi:peptidyl-prolyl cis-trans isomerase SurA
MRRSIDVPGTSMKLAAAILAAGLAVTACGQVQMGAAAIVGSQRVSSSTLSDEVANLNAGYQAHKRQVQLQYPAAQMPQQVLAWIVRFRVRDQLAAREGITVTTADVRAALNQITASIKQSGESATLPEVAVANGLPPDMLNSLGRYQAIETKLLNRLDGGKLPTASAAQQTLETKFNASQCRAAKSLDIKVNPQYGSLNYTDFSVVLVPSALSKPQTSTPTPKASQAVLTPPC